MRFFAFLMIFFLHSAYAFGHIGHVGELAGHGHWVGVGAIVIAAALVGLIIKSGKEETASEVEDDEEQGEVEPATLKA